MHMFPVFFFNDTATTEIYTLSLHDALPICLEFRHDDLEYYTELDAVELEGYVLLNCKRHVYEGHWCFTVFVGLTKNFSRLNLHCFHNFVEAQGKILNLHLHVFK